MHNQSYAHYQGKKPRNFEANRRGQSAFELVMVTGLMLVVFTTFFIVITNSSISAKKERDTQILREISLLISDEIILASSSEDGYTRTFEVPVSIDGINFTAELHYDNDIKNHSEVIIKSVNNPIEVEIVDMVQKDVVGTIVQGSNTIQKRDNVVCLNTAACP